MITSYANSHSIVNAILKKLAIFFEQFYFALQLSEQIG